MKKTVAVLSLAVLAFAGCKKENIESTLLSRLQGHAWRPVDLTYNGMPYTLEDCQLDDELVFLDEQGYDDRGAEKCGEPGPQRSPFTYSVLPDEQTIAVQEDSFGYRYQAVSCDGQYLKMTRVIQQDTLVMTWQAR